MQEVAQEKAAIAEERPRGIRARFAAPFKKLLSLEGSPRQLSLSFGYGMAIGLLPGPGWPLVIATRVVVKAMNLPAAMAGAMVSNPYTFVPLWAFGYWLGNLILQRPLPEDRPIRDWARMASEASSPGELLQLAGRWANLEVVLNLLLPLLLGLSMVSLVVSGITTVVLHRVLERREAKRLALAELDRV